MIPFWKKTDKHSKPQSAQKRRQNAKPAVPRTAQQSIPMQRMFEDGTCRVKPNYYTRTIQYQDINYQLAQQEDKTAIFEEWCSFLNFFDSSIKFELSFVNMATDSTEFEKSIRIPFQKDGFDDVRAEYSQMLRQQLAKGNNGLTKTKFITFGVEGESMAQVKPRLDHIQNDLLNNFHRLGVQAKPLNGVQRLKLMHDMFNMDGASKFHFDWKDLVKSGLSVKDAIAPTAFAFKNSRTFQMGGIYCAASFLSITASDISDQLLKDFLDMDSSQIVTMHIQSVDQNRAIKTVKRTITELDRSKIEEQKKAIRAGYDIDIIPSDLATYGRDAKALLKELQSQNERMFLVTFLVLNTGRTEQELENNVFQASSIAQKHNCNLCRLDFQQEQGLMSSLPLADCQIEIQRGLTTSSTAIFIPFTTQELYQSGKESLYYGLNALSNNLIMVDRKKLKNPNGLILGTPGSGKSFSAKREITNAFLVTDDDIIICDPEAEYAPLVERLHGQVIHIGPASTQYINPMDINSNYSEEDNPLALKADFILSLCELVVGGKEGLQPVEKTVIDRCVHVVYRKYFENPTPENMPLLEDLYNALLTQDEPEARHVAAALEIYVKGSLNIFNHHTNVDIHNRIVCFDIKQLGKQLKKLGMLIVQDAVWGRVTANRSAGKSTRYYADEFHLLLKEEQTAAYSVEIWKRFRKWGGIPTALTQNVKDLLASPEVSNIFENSDFVYILMVMSGFSSCGILFSGGTQVSGQTMYSAEDRDIRGAEQDYKKLEKELDKKIKRTPTDHPGYNEYQYHLDPIEHDPWQLTSFLTTLYDDYTRSEVQGKLKETFKKQYKLTTWVEVQTRYMTVWVISPAGIPIPTQVPYEYRIFHTKLVNRGLEVVIREELDADQWKRYEIFQDTLGGRPYLFNGGLPPGGSDGSGAPGIDYTVPAEALTDSEFAAIYKEAQKYVGTPYVWGGSTPETGFDCSGYVCWVYNQNGYDVGRTTANGLWQKSQHISEAEAKPGDLVFFEGTYDTPGKSHVGIYLGNGMMVSAGDPIKYADIHSSYWQKYLSGFGRLSK